MTSRHIVVEHRVNTADMSGVCRAQHMLGMHDSTLCIRMCYIYILLTIHDAGREIVCHASSPALQLQHVDRPDSGTVRLGGRLTLRPESCAATAWVDA